MDPTEIQQSTADVDNKRLLLPLIKKLNCIPQNAKKAIAEINFLNEFPPHEVTLPEVNFSPRRIIEYMLNTHICTKRKIKERPDLLKTIIYEYEDHSSIVHQFKFSNNMSLAADIFIICYFFYAIIPREYFFLKVMQDLFYMMVNKYELKSTYMIYFDQNAITPLKITYSFPSISFAWYGYKPDINKSLNFSPISTFFDLQLIQNKELWCPIIPAIIPRLNSTFIPITLLVAITIKLNQMIKDNLKIPNYTNIPLKIIYNHILALHFSEAFPTCLKLELCKTWGIIDTKQGEYKYADYFATYRQEAINVILELKSQDPDLLIILSNIHTYENINIYSDFIQH